MSSARNIPAIVTDDGDGAALLPRTARSASRLSRRPSIADRIVAVVSAVDVVDDELPNAADRSFDELRTCLRVGDDGDSISVRNADGYSALGDDVDADDVDVGTGEDATRGLLESDGAGGRRPSVVKSSVADEEGEAEKHGPKDDYVWHFPPRWEEKIAWFDDPIIHACQKLSGNALHVFNIVCLALTAIETGIAVPMVLHIMGLDALAQLATFLMLALCGVSQIPKRFIWRYRPYMVGRARKVRRDLTSSFPSRAVTCGIVYTYGAIAAYNYAHSVSITQLHWEGVLCILGAALLLSFTRVNMGAHYPSDCVIGMFQGTFVCLLGAGLYLAEIDGCHSCLHDDCYGTGESELTWTTLRGLSWPLVVFMSLGGVLLTLLFVAKPIKFWVKCHHAFGMLFPCVMFQAAYLCRPNTKSGVALPPPRSPSWYAYIYAVAAATLTTVIGMRVKGATHRTVLAYIVMFATVLLAVACWRLSM